MTADDAVVRPRRRRAWILLVLALVIGAVLAVVAVRQRTWPSAAAQEDCEEKPPPNAFAVAECEEGTTPPASPAAPASDAAPTAPPP
jgi:hypothetical protein